MGAGRIATGKIIANPNRFWHSVAAYMRIFSVFSRRFILLALAAGLPAFCRADAPNNVVLQYHFLGARELAKSPDVGSARNVFALRSSIAFDNLVLNLLARDTALYLSLPANAFTFSNLGPLLDELQRAESVGSLGATTGQPLDFVLAVKLPKDRAKTWQSILIKVNKGPGDELRAESFVGRQWNGGRTEGFWFVPAGDWLVIGQGESLAATRSAYLRQIQATGQPTTALGKKCFEADVDWPRLAQWAPLATCPFRLARTHIDIAPTSGSLLLTCKVDYGEAVPWQPQPWRVPSELIKEPLVSFTTGQDVEPFLKSDETLASFSSNPLRSQFYFWSMSEMPLESYVAWPEDNPKETLKNLSSEVLAAFNPKLKALNNSQLIWRPDISQILWTGLTLASPHLQAAPESAGSFLVGGLFPLTPGTGPAPEALWEQFKNRTDLVYYDWELTGPRILRLLPETQMVPVFDMLGIHSSVPYTGKKTPADIALDARLRVNEQWLTGLGRVLGNTVTEISKTGPGELTIVRNSPFVFSSLELVLLSHVLSDTPAGPIDYGLIPQAKISGPGMPH